MITASLSGLGPVPNLSVYAATKAAVLSLAISVNLETPRNVRIHALCPDGVQTPMLEAMVGGSRARSWCAPADGSSVPRRWPWPRSGWSAAGGCVRTLPGWRGGVMRFGALMPSQAGPAMGIFAAQGRGRVKKAGKST